MKHVYKSIAILEEARQAEMTADVAKVSETIEGGWMCFSEKGSWTNQAVGLGLSAPITSKSIDRLIAFYKSRGVEPKIELASFADQTLVDALAAKGFLVREFENVMVCDTDIDIDTSGQPEGLSIDIVDIDNRREVETFIKVSTSGFRPTGAPVPEALWNASHQLLSLPRCFSFLARINGIAVSGSSIDIGGKVGCLMGTSVLPDWRRRGIQSALIAHRLQFAAAKGLDLVTIHSHPGIPTERNATRLGFKLAYVKAIMVRPGKGLTPSP